MSGINDFNLYHREYDRWFEKNRNIYLAELKAVKHLIPPHSKSIEIGSGTGKFATPLGIDFGIEPSEKMIRTGAKPGFNSVKAVGESLPIKSGTFDLVLMVTTICFLDDPEKSFREVYRILSKGGYFIVGFVDKESFLGKAYLKKKNKSKFYKSARFYSFGEISILMRNSGFKIDRTVQTLLNEDTSYVHDFKPGSGEGSFLVIRGIK